MITTSSNDRAAVVTHAHDAAVTLLEYGDYECPHCSAAHPIVKQIQETLDDKLRFAFRHSGLVGCSRY